jgi:FSR family fosmidomycin resistance protein-like MFS transporter
VIGVVMLRSWVFLSVLQFVPVLYDDLGFQPAFYGAVATAIILAGAAGTLAGGVLADRIGQRRVIVGSMVLVIPALLLFAGLPGRWAILTGMLFGLLCDASLSVTLVTAQRLMPGRVGMASGMILGLGFVTGGIGVPITGLIADAVGFRFALMSLSLLAGIGAILGSTLPGPEAIKTINAL